MQKLILMLVCTGIFFNIYAQKDSVQKKVNNIELAPKGVYAEIDVQNSNGLVEFLNRGEADVKIKAAEEVLKRPNDYNPTVLFALSEVLFNNDKKMKPAFGSIPRSSELATMRIDAKTRLLHLVLQRSMNAMDKLSISMLLKT